MSEILVVIMLLSVGLAILRDYFEDEKFPHSSLNVKHATALMLMKLYGDFISSVYGAGLGYLWMNKGSLSHQGIVVLSISMF